MNGFFVRVTAQCDRASRQLHVVADSVKREGLDEPAGRLRDIASAVSRLAFDAAKKPDDPEFYNRIGTVTYDAHRAVHHVASQMRTLSHGPRGAVFLKAALDLEGVAVILHRINVDTLKETQPISEPKP